ncbi:protein shisa-4-like [Branchiostoma floridae]|uniref:Protein shisa-4-like n=1 Tax=Branchiostoma floridae TaxID=7739 RepID=C3Z2S7_BRAFL|nr:protein shisa-4-like [Branchiostoma floridae]|eukprot:XP_002597316.1 hypothetical protein BRAFLDRAFT_118183 [Branchiostoma floridae]
MSGAVVLFLIFVLGTASGERCRGYTDIFGDYHAGFNCPTSSDFSSETYCCGISSNPYCCSSCLFSQYTISCDDDILYLSTGAIVGIAVGCIAFVAIIITVCCCCCCACCAPCCCRSDPATTTTVITNQPAAAVTVAQTSYQPYPQYPPPSGEMAQYPPPGQQYPPPGQYYPPQGQQGGLAYPPPYPGQGGQPVKQ